MELTPRIHLVGSGAGGLGLTDAYDCNVYLLDGGSEAALIDAGIGSMTEPLLVNAERIVDLGRLRRLVITHGHPDHCGGAAALKQRLPWIEVCASGQVATWMISGDAKAMSIETGKRADFYPADYRFHTCMVDRGLAEGDEVAVGDLVLDVLETPGHADGHLALVCRTPEDVALFSGDLLFFGGRISLVNNWDCRIQSYAQSMAKVGSLGVNALFPGHHAMSLAQGQRHIDAANRLFERGFVPRSIV